MMNYKIFAPGFGLSQWLFLFLALLFTAGCNNAPLPNSFTPFNAENLYDFSRYQNFDDYVKSYRLAIGRVRPDISPSELNNLAPFPVRPEENEACANNSNRNTGILFLHGYSDSAFSFKDLRDALASLCYGLYSPVLPGHALKPGALLDIRMEDWQALTDFAVTEIKKERANIILAGYSTGGALSVDYILQEGNEEIKQLMLFNPLFEINGLPPLAGPIFTVTSFLGRKNPAWGWLSKQPETEPYRYHSTPFNGGLQTFRIAKEVSRKLKTHPFSTHSFMVFTENDATVKADASFAFARFHLSGRDRVLFYNKPLKERPPIAAKLYSLPSEHEGLKVRNMGHIAPLERTTNPIWGVRATYPQCFHYYGKDSVKFEKCISGSYDFHGEKLKKHMKSDQIFRRISFNPAFHLQLEHILQFLAAPQD